MIRIPKSHGSGEFEGGDFAALGIDVVFEAGVLVFHAENIEIGDRVYVGHGAILKGYYRNRLRIGSGSWIGQRCFLHAAGGIEIGESVGIAPGVQILTSVHQDPGPEHPIMEGTLEFRQVSIGDGADIGIGAIILPGVSIGRGAQIGAGAVVTRDVRDFAVAAGNPARELRLRK